MKRPFTVPALHDPSRMVTYEAHDPERIWCPSTRKECHTLASCRFTRCMYGHGGLTKKPAQPAQGVLPVQGWAARRRTHV